MPINSPVYARGVLKLDKEGLLWMAEDKLLRLCISEMLKLLTLLFVEVLSSDVWRFHLSRPSIRYARKATALADVPTF